MLRAVVKEFTSVTFMPPLMTMFSRQYHDKAYVNGQWISAKTGTTFPVTSPATGKNIINVTNMGVDDATDAINAASQSFQKWSSTSAKERSQLLRSWYNKVVENADKIASILSEESGKPLSEAHGEVTYGSSFLEWFSEEARRIQGEVLSSPVPTRELFHIKQPVGVAALITPWNFPLAMITRKAGAALAAGCTVVIKPAEDTPLTALILAECAHDAGIPAGVINVLPSDRVHSAAIGKLFCEDPKIAVISFTGSTAVGKILYSQCASSIKRLALELGGNAPFIVFKSANLDKAVEGAVASKFRNAGQTCVSSNRFFIQDVVYDEFVEKLTKCVKERFSFAADPKKQQLGPLINDSQFTKVDNIVKDAVSKGAQILTGACAASNIGPLFYEPTVLSNIRESMQCYRDEIFGPVIPCIKFSTEEEVLSMANETRTGLAGYFYSSDVSQIFRVARKLEVGMVGINEGIISTAEAAFGGIKESGLGREGSHHGLDEFLHIKYLCLGSL